MEIKEALSRFGLSSDEQEAILALNRHPWVTALQLSRFTTVKRSTLYRVLEKLIKLGLVEQKVDDKTTYYKTAEPTSFESLVKEKEKEANVLRLAYGDILTGLAALSQAGEKQTSVTFFRGVRGLQSMEWKMCEEENVVTKIFGSNQWSEMLGKEFAEEVREARVAQNIKVREILNEGKISIIPDDGAVEWTENKEYVLNHFLHRQVSEDILKMENEIVVLPEKVFLFSFEADEPVGIMIANKAYAQMLSQMFEVVWMLSEPVDHRGE